MNRMASHLTNRRVLPIVQFLYMEKKTQKITTKNPLILTVHITKIQTLQNLDPWSRVGVVAGPNGTGGELWIVRWDHYPAVLAFWDMNSTSREMLELRVFGREAGPGSWKESVPERFPESLKRPSNPTRLFYRWGGWGAERSHWREGW